VTAYAYDDAGRMTTVTLPSGTDIVSTYSYDDADRLLGIEHVQGGTTTLAFVEYTLDDVGNRVERVDHLGTHTYVYDDLYRLTSVTYPGPSTTTYAFDAFGNRTSMTEPGSQTTTYAYDDADRLETVTPPGQSAIAYTWDANGSLTARGSDSFAWDYEERLVEATVNSLTTTFAYRGDGLRDSRTVGITTTTFTWDINAGLPVVLDDGGAQYVYGLGLVSQNVGNDSYYYLADGLGSTMVTVDSSGSVVNSYTYDVYGAVTSSSGSQDNEFQFAGQQVDSSTGLQYLRARYYDSSIGNFRSRDPLASAPPWSRHPFGYALANPATVVDPLGLDGCRWRRPWNCGDDALNKGWEEGAGVGKAAWDAGTDVTNEVRKSLGGVWGRTVDSFTPPYTASKVLTIIQAMDIVPLSAMCLAFGPGAAVTCAIVEVGIGTAAAYAAAYQTAHSGCSINRKVLSMGFILASFAVEISDPVTKFVVDTAAYGAQSVAITCPKEKP
jgi:RHS repeat-associated protein